MVDFPLTDRTNEFNAEVNKEVGCVLQSRQDVQVNI